MKRATTFLSLLALSAGLLAQFFVKKEQLEARLLYFVGSEIPKVQYILSPLPV